jgi:hypothetical protein
VQGSCDSRAAKRLVGSKFFAQGHQSRHFVFGEANLVATFSSE